MTERRHLEGRKGNLVEEFTVSGTRIPCCNTRVATPSSFASIHRYKGRRKKKRQTQLRPLTSRNAKTL